MPKKSKKEQDEPNVNLTDGIDDLDKILKNGDNISDDDVVKNEVLENLDIVNQASGANDLQHTVDSLKYLFANNEDRPIFAEKLLSDGDNRIKEFSMLTTINNLANVPKISALKQTLMDDIAKKVESVQYLSIQDKLNILTLLDNMEKNAQERAFKYIQMSRDFNSLPTIYRQLVDKLMIISDDKAPRLKAIPALIDLPDELWNRIMEIVEIWNKN